MCPKRANIMFGGCCPVNLQIVAGVKRGLAYEKRPCREVLGDAQVLHL